MSGQTAAGKILSLKTFPVGKSVRKDHTFGTIESGKYVGPMKAPVSGEVVEINQEVLKDPSIINDAPYKNWIILIKPTNIEEDLKDLIHGKEAIYNWIIEEIDDYIRKDLLSCE